MSDAVKIFDDYEYLLRRFKKSEYIADMEVFRKKYDGQIEEILGFESDDLYEEFSKEVYARYSFMGKVGKMKKKELGLFMIYFVFPGMLLKGEETKDKTVCESSCEKLLDAWNKTFDADISYMDYASILEGFNDKMFGIF